MNDFHGLPVRRLTSSFLELDCLATAGPRIVSLRYKGSPNILADVPGSLTTPYGDYHYMGGHRLWHAPEAMPRSYIPDGEGLVISELPDGLRLDGRVEPGTGIRKCLEVHLAPDHPKVTLVHTLVNEGLWDVELAPWAITMLRLGGVAILPTRAGSVDLQALLPDRHFSLWPYSRMDDPRLKLADDFIAVRPRTDLPPFKIGTFNPAGWTAYWLENMLFRKTYAADAATPHPDNGCNAEIYCNGQLIELESLGSLRRLEAGCSLTHDESWEFYDSIDQGFLSPRMRQLLMSEAA